MKLNPKKRTELSVKIRKANIRIWIESGAIEAKRKFLSLSNLTDNEFCHLSSSVLWGLKSGIILTSDRTCSVKWEVR